MGRAGRARRAGLLPLVAVLAAVSAVALATVLGYRSGREAERAGYRPVASLLEERGEALAAEFRAGTPGAGADSVRWILPAHGPGGTPYLMVVVAGADPDGLDPAALCARVRAFLTRAHGLDLAGVDGELLMDDDGRVLHRVP